MTFFRLLRNVLLLPRFTAAHRLAPCMFLQTRVFFDKTPLPLFVYASVCECITASVTSHRRCRCALTVCWVSLEGESFLVLLLFHPFMYTHRYVQLSFVDLLFASQIKRCKLEQTCTHCVWMSMTLSSARCLMLPYKEQKQLPDRFCLIHLYMNPLCLCVCDFTVVTANIAQARFANTVKLFNKT